jgi:DNA-binding transcriptional MerR regulator
MREGSAKSRRRLHRTADPLGYRIGDEQRDGFPDDPRLTRGQRLRIAGWARALAPETLTDTQRELLGDTARQTSPAAERAAELSGFEASPYWTLLDDRRRALVRDPSNHPDLRDADYPLGVAQLATLVGATADKVRYWHNSGLLPARRSSGRHREFYAAAAVRAFYLNALGRPGITVLRDLVQGRGAPLLLGISAALHDKASDSNQSDRDLMRRAAADLEQVGAGLLEAS